MQALQMQDWLNQQIAEKMAKKQTERQAVE
jgi:hypothetical protein